MPALAAYSAAPSPFDSHAHLLHGVVHANGFGHLARVNGREGGSQQLSGVDHHIVTHTTSAQLYWLSQLSLTVIEPYCSHIARAYALIIYTQLHLHWKACQSFMLDGTWEQDACR